MTSKGKTAARLLIFLVLAFGIAWIPAVIMNKKIGYEEWFVTDHYFIFVQFVIFAPAIANVLTRLITKEGFGQTYLRLNLKGNVRYYILAAAIPIAVGLITGLAATLIYGKWDLAEIRSHASWKTALGFLLSTATAGPLIAFQTFGEEFGWRAYMNQKMEPLLGTVGTCILGGIIWGVWHAPLTIEGHNFGKDYAGYPYAGIALMALFCTLHGIMLMWLVKKTGSVIPAAIFHAVNNNGGFTVGNMLISGIKDMEAFNNSLGKQAIVLIPYAVIALAVMISMVIDKRRTERKE
ncbi:MAG TPA: type II CAAX endopeptidase family protein [Ruminococcus sp.]|nr:type II CAAX endopeptidase family protein [Ruminococcus sp.]